MNHVEKTPAVQATHSEIGGVKWPHVLVIGLSEAFSLYPRHLRVSNDIGAGGDALAWTGYQPSDSIGTRAANVTLLGAFSDTQALVLPPSMYSTFGLFHVAPIHPLSKSAFLGEIGKWVPVADDRVASVTDSAAGLTVEVMGPAGEAGELAFAAGSKATHALSAVCTIGATGTATATFDGKVVTCRAGAA